MVLRELYEGDEKTFVLILVITTDTLLYLFFQKKSKSLCATGGQICLCVTDGQIYPKQRHNKTKRNKNQTRKQLQDS